MLKIKDDVDLKELEKFGFKQDYFVDEKVYLKTIETDYHIEQLTIWAKEKSIQSSLCIDLLDTLFDLIQAGLVEKVDDK